VRRLISCPVASHAVRPFIYNTVASRRGRRRPLGANNEAAAIVRPYVRSSNKIRVQYVIMR